MELDTNRVIKCYDSEQQELYNKLNDKQKAYIELRVAGMGKSEAYRNAGYETKNSRQAAYTLENGRLKGLIECRIKLKQARQLMDADSNTFKDLEAKANLAQASNVLNTVKSANLDTVEQIKFYRDIASGKIRSHKITEFTDKEGKKSTKEEFIDDVATRIQARKELDRILGLNQINTLGSINAGGNVNINIIDASKKTEDAKLVETTKENEEEQEQDTDLVEKVATKEVKEKGEVIIEDNNVKIKTKNGCTNVGYASNEGIEEGDDNG